MQNGKKEDQFCKEDARKLSQRMQREGKTGNKTNSGKGMGGWGIGRGPSSSLSRGQRKMDRAFLA